jgi:hypothetical protein
VAQARRDGPDPGALEGVHLKQRGSEQLETTPIQTFHTLHAKPAARTRTFLGLADDLAAPGPVSPSSPKPVPLPHAMVEPSAATTVWVFPHASAWISHPCKSYSGLGYMAESLVGFMRPDYKGHEKFEAGRHAEEEEAGKGFVLFVPSRLRSMRVKRGAHPKCA